MFSKATLKERRQYYREEWSPKDLPDFISTDIRKREFGFDHNGRGPNDRYKVFKGILHSFSELSIVLYFEILLYTFLFVFNNKHFISIFLLPSISL